MTKILIFLAGVSFLAFACQKQPALKDSKSQNSLPASKFMKLTSPAFASGQPIPQKYTCQGENIYPPLNFQDVPSQTKSLALIMDDPDIPKNLKPDGVFDHWVVFNLVPSTREITQAGDSEPLGLMGLNSAGKTAYTGPCPPDGQHRYFFRLYALDVVLPLKEGSNKQEVLKAMQGHILEVAELIGTYIKK